MQSFQETARGPAPRATAMETWPTWRGTSEIEEATSPASGRKNKALGHGAGLSVFAYWPGTLRHFAGIPKDD